ncbi:MAG: hypothetical protein GC155_11395 [Alphaproteobacteria bacterium]|nr:hypothetical protein [Alphaproteobacteria bacterium]
MILVCPSCDTRYFAEDSAVGKEGRRVRCASCGHSWFARVQEDGDVASADSTGLTREQVERLRQTAAANSASRSGPHSEYRAREHAKRKRNRLMATGIAWAVAFVLFVSLAGTAVALRGLVVQAWPQSASIYRAVGLKVNRFGLEFANVTAKRSFDGTTPVLTVTGNAINKGKTRRASPLVRVSLRDEAGKEVHAWTDSLSVPFIGPGESVPFKTRIVAPPLETWRLAVTYSDALGSSPEESGAAVGHDEIGGDAERPARAAAAMAETGETAPPVAHPPAEAEPSPPWGAGDGPDEAPPPAQAAATDPVPAPATAKEEAAHH